MCRFESVSSRRRWREWNGASRGSREVADASRPSGSVWPRHRRRVPRRPTPTTAELEALRRELATLRTTLAQRERDLAAAAANRPQEPEPDTNALTAREAALEAREASLAAAAAELDGRTEELSAREAALTEREATLAKREQQPSDEDDEARAEAKLEELRLAEQAFVKTRAELAAHSDALAERESRLVARERALESQQAQPAPELEALEARIRRLEQGGRRKDESTQTFRAGLRALEHRGLRPPSDTRKEPLH